MPEQTPTCKLSQCAAAIDKTYFDLFVSNRFVTLFGPRNKCSAKFELKNLDKNPFERGKTDVFKLSSNYVGPIQKIRIEHDNAGKAPGCK